MRPFGLRRLLRQQAADTGFVGGNDVELLRGGDALFPAMQAAIHRAHREVASLWKM